jgi:hypothetical protein
MGVSSLRSLTALQAALQACLLCFSAPSFLLQARFASHFTSSSGQLMPRDALREYLRP